MPYVYNFWDKIKPDKILLGGKGAGLFSMTQAGLPVPPGFTITTEACRRYMKEGKLWPELRQEVLDHMKQLEEKTGKKFGDPSNPLLVSVRSGAPVSMPGMMDTILNVGLNDETVKGLAKLTNNERFALDAYRRLIQMYGSIVLGIPREKFEEVLDEAKKKAGVKTDAELKPEHLREVIAKFKEIVSEKGGLPQDPNEQLFSCIETVFKSWNNPRAITYRRINKIPEEWGTAVNVVMMVFGNMGDDSGTGVLFTRDPTTGEKKLYGEFLPNAQGEDVVAGIRTPLKLEELKEKLPDVYKQLVDVAEKLEKYYRDMQDIEFTVERGKLYLLQTRTGKRTPYAAVKIAVDMVKEGLIDKKEAVLRVNPYSFESLFHMNIDPKAKVTPIAKGIPASPGAAVGKVVFDPDDAVEKAREGPVILVRPETTPDDIHGIAASVGVLTSRGGKTSHAAVVTRAMGKPCIVGTEEIDVDVKKKQFVAPGGVVVKEGDVITIDGTTGKVYLGEVPLIPPKIGGVVEELLSWADEFRLLRVRANANTPEDAKNAKRFGAEGIGLLRIERMFEGERLKLIRNVILAETKEDRIKHLKEVVKVIKGDFKEIFKEVEGLPTTVRLLDPPLHEFLPNIEELKKEIADARSKGDEKKVAELEKVLKRAMDLHEINPMIGFRGTRVGMVYPEIYEYLGRAVLEAAAELIKEGHDIKLEIMFPMVTFENELKILVERFKKLIEEVGKEYGVELKVPLGTMVEVARTAVMADKMAEYAEFFSFGTNDLTQTSCALSREDVERTFIPFYVENKIIPDNPFGVLDDGVARLVEIAVQKGRETRPELEVGVCGEHGGDPISIEKFHKAGLDYVSCSPFRIPVARLAAAQAQLKFPREKKH